MITKEQALENAKKYIKNRNRNFVNIASLNEIQYKEQIEIPYGKYEEQIKSVFVVFYDVEGYYGNVPCFIYVDAETGEVLFTMTEHGYAEEWEEE